MSRTFSRFLPAGFTRLLVAATVTSGPPASVGTAERLVDRDIRAAVLLGDEINGDIATRAGTVPVFMTFDDAADNLAGRLQFPL